MLLAPVIKRNVKPVHDFSSKEIWKHFLILEGTKKPRAAILLQRQK